MNRQEIAYVARAIRDARRYKTDYYVSSDLISDMAAALAEIDESFDRESFTELCQP